MGKVAIWVSITILGLALGAGVGLAQLSQPEEDNRKGAAGTITEVSGEALVLDVPAGDGKKPEGITFKVEHDVVVKGVREFVKLAVGDKVYLEYITLPDKAKTKIAEFIERTTQ